MRDALSSFLKSHGFKVVAVDSTEDGIDAFDEAAFDIGLVDINLPGKSGFSMIEYIREQGSNMPLLAMTARDGLHDKLTGFGLGLNDYVTKPFDLQELLARMQAHLRLAGATSEEAEINTGSYRLNPESWNFYVKDKLVALTKTEFRIMHRLMLSSGLVVKNNDLVEYVWGDSSDDLSPPVRIHIANLRKKIGDDQFSIIKTIPGIGYKLNDLGSSNHAV